MHDKSLTKRIINLSIPNSLQALLRLLSGFTLTLMVARIGTKNLAAMALAYTVYLNFILFMTGVSYALSILVGKASGTHDDEAISDLFIQGFWVAIILIVPATLLFRNGYYIFLAFGQNPQVAALAQTYLNGLSWGVWAFVFLIALKQYLLGLGRVFILNVTGVTSLITIVLAGYALIFGHWGLPKLGLAGAGYAISVAAVINLTITIFYILLQPKTAKYIHFKKIQHVKFKTIKTIFNIGFPISMNMLAEVIAGSILVFIIGIVDHFALAAYQVVSQIIYIPLMFPFAISQACSIITSQNIGEGKPENLPHITRISSIVAIIPVFCCSLLFWLIPTHLVKLFIQSHHINATPLIQLAAQMLMVSGIFQLIDALRLIGIGTLRGLKDVKMPLYISLFSFWIVSLSVVAVVAFVLHASVIWIWISAGIGIVIGLLLVQLRLKRQYYTFVNTHA